MRERPIAASTPGVARIRRLIHEIAQTPHRAMTPGRHRGRRPTPCCRRGHGTAASFHPASYGSCNGDVDCFLACTRAHESDTSGGYGRREQRWCLSRCVPVPADHLGRGRGRCRLRRVRRRPGRPGARPRCKTPRPRTSIRCPAPTRGVAAANRVIVHAVHPCASTRPSLLRGPGRVRGRLALVRDEREPSSDLSSARSPMSARGSSTPSASCGRAGSTACARGPGPRFRVCSPAAGCHRSRASFGSSYCDRARGRPVVRT